MLLIRRHSHHCESGIAGCFLFLWPIQAIFLVHWIGGLSCQCANCGFAIFLLALGAYGQNILFKHDGLSRQYRIHIPENISLCPCWSLLCTATPATTAMMISNYGWIELADNGGLQSPVPTARLINLEQILGCRLRFHSARCRRRRLCGCFGRASAKSARLESNTNLCHWISNVRDVPNSPVSRKLLPPLPPSWE